MGTFGKTVHQSVTKIYGNPCDICQQLGEGHTSDYIQGSTLAMCPLARMHFLGRRASSGHNN